MKFIFQIQIVFLLALLLICEINGHGRLLNPPNRSSIWRFPEFDHLSPPKNYDDNAMNCGGFSFQYEQQGGKCGECGDPYNHPRPRANEGGGKFGRGIIVRNYTAGEEIPILVELTANHRGYFEFRLCPHNFPNVPANQECFDQNILILAAGSGSGSKYFVGEGSIFNFNIKLPEKIRCSQCVLQWHYSAGNNWGICEDGKGALGCGPQENFRGCADIAIF